jgi:hypothetical protein
MLVLLAAAACGDSQAPPAKAWPKGTVLALEGRPILASEVDEAAGCIALLEPRDSFEQLRRLALTNVVLPRCAAQAIDPEARVEAQRKAEEFQRSRTGDPLVERKGRMLDLGLELWNAAMPLEPGQWTPVVETAGCFHVARLVQKDTAALPGLVELTLESCDFPYLPAAEAHNRIDAQLDRSQLAYIDESWRAFVPLVWQHRLRGGTQ